MSYVVSNAERRRQYFWQTLDGLIGCMQAQPVIAYNHDPDAPPGLKWSLMTALYKADVEKAVRKALPRQQLQRAFWKLAVRRAYGLTSPEQFQDKLTGTVISRCAKVFIERRLAPRTYFTERRAAP
jgi:hypothetical protein